ncbi:MAG: cytochrome P450 [Acidimicrobiia bacterium]|nr:cytochrome P450 [Acidimicrobiia bacterium]
MRAEAPVYFDEANDVWGVTRYEDVRTISGDPEAFSNAGGIRPGRGPMPMMIDMDDPDHIRRRKLVNRGFTPRRVRDLLPSIERACDEILDRVADRGSCDLVADVAAPLPMAMIGDALGVAPEDRDTLLRWSDDMVCSQSASATEEMLERATESYGDYLEHVSRVIADRRQHPTDDLISVLVHAEVDGDRLSEDEVLHESLLILIGGDETTRHVISGGIHALLTTPGAWERLAEDRSLLPSATEEMLRWVSPIKNMARTVTRDLSFGGQELHVGQKVLLLYPAANRDPEVFANPHRFDIERHPNDHVAFGFGTHFCLGASLARLEISTMVDRILTRLPDLRLAGDGTIRPANFVSGHESLPVTFTP